MNATTISVLLIDDHTVVRAGFRMLLDAHEFIGDIHDIDRGELVCSAYEQQRPDVVVMDLSMPGIGGLEAIRRLLRQHTNAKVLVYSIHDDAIYVERAMQTGASGYITKNSAADILVEAVQAIAAGLTYIEHRLSRNAEDVRDRDITEYRSIIDRLSPREFDIFCRLAAGTDAHAIADELCLSYKTVANYHTQIKTKLHSNTVAELANIATALGISKPPLL